MGKPSEPPALRAPSALNRFPPFQQSKPAGFYSWTVIENVGDLPEPPCLGAVGVCDDQARALDLMADALRDSPDGAVGLLHKVALNPSLNGYCYDDLLTRAHVDPDSGAVVTSDRRPRGRWAPPGDVFAEIARAAGAQATDPGTGVA